ncbi:hypothetical protein K474DRAFT_203733 [Panus rudis PR-1116 ss-1]|nr:hypothetical protein K474DRAFT_203733 [Panus rudis PR-1116 ss-1]
MVHSPVVGWEETMAFLIGVICRSSNMIAAAMALYVTWRKTAFVYLRDQEIAKNTSLLALFLYNGVVLFALSTIIIGRFMLDLRYIHTPGDSPHSNTQGHQNGSHVTSIVFNVTLGNLGSVQQSRPSWLSGAGDDGQLEEEELAFSDEPLKAAALDLRPDNELELQEIGRRDDPDPSV